ncbi:DUF7482 domain-containing protein [Candidatus Nitrosotenuis chungbukensis]|uniref:DUF7482 domain-containing protein n=1 Tax=Candidatus Nitrosotenuis chungbukensis TaxID=1353246 RepID=UPI003B96799E
MQLRWDLQIFWEYLMYQKLANALSNSIVSEMYQFKNGVKGPGPLGYQASVMSSTLEEGSYVPVCRVSIVEWNDPIYAGILETVSDINSKKSEKMITVQACKTVKQRPYCKLSANRTPQLNSKTKDKLSYRRLESLGRKTLHCWCRTRKSRPHDISRKRGN